MKSFLLFIAVAFAAGPATAQSFSADELVERTIERRAVEAVNWGMPAVNFDRMLQAMIDAGGSINQIVYWPRLQNWKNQTLTPNPDVIYVMPFFSTKEAGPMVLEIPAANGGSITGTIMDSWQSAFEDVGPAGLDKGKGGKYLILPPGYAAAVPEGYFALPSKTYQGYALLRSILKSGSESDLVQAIAYAKEIKLYPLSQAANPPPAAFLNADDVVFDATIPYDIRFFQSLDRFVQYEPWLDRDKAMIDVLRSVGIEQGKPFTPDAKREELLTRTASEAHAWLDAKFERLFIPYNTGNHWSVPIAQDFIETQATFWEKPGIYAVDGRGAYFQLGFSTVKHLGQGQFYLFTIHDGDGKPLDGSANYRLSVPANAPAKQYWSAVVYDRATHALIREVSSPSKSSLTPGLKTNADGSADIYFGPKPPPGKESNWIPTDPSGRFEVAFRFYGPEQSLFDKTWVLPDVVRVEAQ